MGPNGASAAELSGPVAGRPVLALGTYPLEPLGYVEEEYFLSGAAQAFAPAGPLDADGRWSVRTAGRAPFKTRIVVVRPRDPAKFNGTVLVEWLNVSAGTDGAPDWNYAHRELLRSGFAWVGVSAQKVGIEGGGRMSFPGASPLKAADPNRYRELSHPGDAYAFDIFTEAARAVRGEDGAQVLGPLRARRLIASGESQSAAFLTTYVNAVQPISRAFDAFLIHSRFGGSAALTGRPEDAPKEVRIRTDLAAPVLMFITETDLLGFGAGYFPARQPDTDTIRTWEVAGTAHADTYTLGGAMIDSGSEPISVLAAAFAATGAVGGMPMPVPINSAPQHHYVLQSAVAALQTWIVRGEAPTRGDRLEVAPGPPPELLKTALGEAKGGVRSPWMDAPTAVLSGLGQTAPGLGALFGVTRPFSAETLADLYPGGRADYLARFDAALEEAIARGFILAADRDEIRALAAESYPGPGR